MSTLQPTEDVPRLRKRGKWRQLATRQDVRLALARVIKDVYDSEISFERGAVCVSGLRALATIIKEDSDLSAAQRIRALEEQIASLTQ